MSNFHYLLTIFFIVLLSVSIFLMLPTKATLFIWQNTKPFSLIDIPWRFLGISVFSLSFLAAFVAKSIKSGLVFILLVFAVLIANRNHLRINQVVFRDNTFFLNYTGTATQYDEFTPKWRQTTRVPVGFDSKRKIEVTVGQVDIQNITSKSQEISFTADVKTQRAAIRINKFYFPTWQVKLDGRELRPFDGLIITDTANVRLDEEQDNSGLMQINLSKGIHQIEADFKETPLRLLADYLTLSTLLLAGGVIIKKCKEVN